MSKLTADFVRFVADVALLYRSADKAGQIDRPFRLDFGWCGVDRPRLKREECAKWTRVSGECAGETIAALRLADGVLDEVARLATSLLSDASSLQVGAAIIERLGAHGAFRQQIADACFRELGHGRVALAKRTSDVQPGPICPLSAQ